MSHETSKSCTISDRARKNCMSYQFGPCSPKLAVFIWSCRTHPKAPVLYFFSFHLSFLFNVAIIHPSLPT
jgi:hypothetical protein